MKGGSVLTAYFEKESGAFGLLTEGSTVTTNAQYVLVGIRSRPQGEDTWSTSNLKIPQGEIALVLYREIGGRNELVQVFTASGDGKKDHLRRAEAPAGQRLTVATRTCGALRAPP